MDPGYNHDGAQGTGQLFSGGDPIQGESHNSRASGAAQEKVIEVEEKMEEE